MISYLRLYFANIVRTSTSGLDSKIVWFYASVKMNPIKLELKRDKREPLVQQGCQEGLGISSPGGLAEQARALAW